MGGRGSFSASQFPFASDRSLFPARRLAVTMAALTDKSLLSAELEEDGDGDGDEDEEFQRLLLQATQKIQSTMPSAPDSKPIRPQPGFCIKTHASPTEKVFVNVCRSPHIPPPPDLTPQELECLIESDSASAFRIPMSLGEPHAELDKSGNGCTAYDVVINTGFFNKLEANLLFKEFFITVALEGLAEKYSTNINHPAKVARPKRPPWSCPIPRGLSTGAVPGAGGGPDRAGGRASALPSRYLHPSSHQAREEPCPVPHGHQGLDCGDANPACARSPHAAPLKTPHFLLDRSQDPIPPGKGGICLHLRRVPAWAAGVPLPPPLKHPAMREAGWGARTSWFSLQFGKREQKHWDPKHLDHDPPLAYWEQAASTPEFLPLKFEARILLACVAVVGGRERLHL
uniref:PIH1 domain containing 1 n=1 Tax=Crocodylus porosus TaxID=8502 RepID=A0A7M4FI64_CROPO